MQKSVFILVMTWQQKTERARSLENVLDVADNALGAFDELFDAVEVAGLALGVGGFVVACTCALLLVLGLGVLVRAGREGVALA